MKRNGMTIEQKALYVSETRTPPTVYLCIFVHQAKRNRSEVKKKSSSSSNGINGSSNNTNHKEIIDYCPPLRIRLPQNDNEIRKIRNCFKCCVSVLWTEWKKIIISYKLNWFIRTENQFSTQRHFKFISKLKSDLVFSYWKCKFKNYDF